MQPYFVPYLGYFQLINAVDTFVIYDNIEYTKKGWISRNRILRPDGTIALLSLSLKKDSDYLDIRDRQLAETFEPRKLLNQVAASYRRSPHYDVVYPLIERIVAREEPNLFDYLRFGILETCEYLGIATKVVTSSSLDVDSALPGEQRVVQTCRALGATTYINAPGGASLYSATPFSQAGIGLRFIQPAIRRYEQYGNGFVPALSIIDVMMFNSRESIISMLNNDYELS